MSDNKQIDSSSVISEKRRKLLKASVATPLVATLTFGSGQAAATSAYQCMTKHIPDVGYITGTDLAMRVEATRYTKKDEIACYEIGINVYREDGNDCDFNLQAAQGEEQVNVLIMYEKNDGNGIQPASATDVWPNFQLIADDPSQVTNQPLYGTCYTSVILGNISSIKGNIV